jgi:hypothetical protein
MTDRGEPLHIVFYTFALWTAAERRRAPLENRSLDPQPVTDSRFGNDPAWMGWVVLEFAAQVVDVDAELARVFGGIPAPDALEELPVGHHLTDVP